MAESDVSLTFDNKMFLKGLEGISKKLESLVGSTEKTTEKISKGVSISAMSFLKINAALSVAKMGISRLMSNIPEIGQTFKIAGDIITRNFLWPLRQQLMPYLQKFLNYVRDHRVMFVRWGSVLSNVFQVVVKGIKAAINILKPFYDAAMKFFKDIFGKTADSVDKIANMILFKIAAVIVYLEAVLKPSMVFIANIVFKILEAVKSFVEGLAEAYIELGGIGSELEETLKALSEMSTALFGAGNGWKLLGQILGYTVVPALKLVLITLTGIAKVLTLAGGMASGISAMLSGDKKGISAAATALTGEDPAEIDKKIAAHWAKKDAEAKLKIPANAVTLQSLTGGNSPVDNSSKVNITNLTVHASTEEGGQKAGKALYIELKGQMNTGKAVRGH